MKRQNNYIQRFLVLLFFYLAITARVFAGVCAMVHSHTPQDTATQKIIVIPASDFLYELPKGNTIIDADNAGTSWLFNNTGVLLKSLTNMITQIRVEEAGQYHLFVRSLGKKGNSFKIAVNDKVTDTTFGSDRISWKKGGTFDLKAGSAVVKVTRIHPGSVIDVIVLTKDPALKETDILQYQLNKE